MIRYVLLFLLLTIPAFADAPDRRISDADGHTLILNSDGSIPVTCVSGCSGSGAQNIGGTTATVGRLLVGDGLNFNSSAVWNMQNGEFIDNAIDGRICWSTNNAGGVGLPEDVCWDMGTDGKVSLQGGALGDATVFNPNFATTRIGDEDQLSFGNADDVRFIFETTGNDNMQIGLVSSGSGAGSGYISLMERDDLGVANRSPNSNATTPKFRVYSTNENQPFDYIQLYYNTATSQGVLEVGQGTLSIPGHLQVGAWTATSGNLLIGDGASNFQSVALSGDAVITSQGVISLGSGLTATSGNLLMADGVKFNSVSIGGLNLRAASGANTACTTTCGSAGAAGIGLDAGTTAFVDKTSALADSCLCLP